ncbi:PilT protein domain protein [Candidatus Moduliflexus flocculans]|uniref:PilT protein domain protein n=1 Tax=Candidatus Moduliflexus flocculans TaxID=1499966 RepID=A0A0S6VT68_9BACT|nr:PilT protein domain protein [Candidatus Moduliflexus flocculans]
MRLVCFDTQVIIWGVKQEATPGQESMIEKSKYLIQKCTEDGDRIIIPSIVVAELLMPMETRLHQTFTSLMQRKFIIPTFDLKAASHFAKVWQQKKDIRKELMDNRVATRAELKADSMIIATAISNEVSCIYSQDVPLKSMATSFIEVKDVPEIPVDSQLSFLAN